MRIKTFSPDLTNSLVIVVVWLIMVILVNPIGNFPLNDDWSYGRAVQNLVEKGEFRLQGWTATNLASQVFWGAIFSLPFGFSFTALRFSTLTLGLIGVLSTYGLIRILGINPKYSFLGALLIAINPIYFVLSNTFMNDIPFFAFATLSLFFLFSGLKRDSPVQISIGIVLTLATILTRQTGLVIPIAFGLAYLYKKGLNVKSFIIGFLPTLFGFGLQFSYQKWLQITMRIPESYNNQINTMFEELKKGVANVISNYTWTSLYSLIYLGLFLFPLLAIVYPIKYKELSSRKRLFSISFIVAFSILVLVTLSSHHKLMPLMINILYDFGLGPITMRNPDVPGAPDFFWLGMTIIGVLGAALVVTYLLIAIIRIFQKQRLQYETNKKWLDIFIISTTFIYFIPLGVLGFSKFGFYDRYLIFLLPFLVMIAYTSTEKTFDNVNNKKYFYIPLILILPYAFFTVCATHDYLSSNRTRWTALNNLMQEQKVPPDKIDGGFEFNGWFLYKSQYNFNKSWYWVDEDDYVISFSDLDGYKVVDRYGFRAWLPWGHTEILVLGKCPRESN